MCTLHLAIRTHMCEIHIEALMHGSTGPIRSIALCRNIAFSAHHSGEFLANQANQGQPGRQAPMPRDLELPAVRRYRALLRYGEGLPGGGGCGVGPDAWV